MSEEQAKTVATFHKLKKAIAWCVLGPIVVLALPVVAVFAVLGWAGITATEDEEGRGRP